MKPRRGSGAKLIGLLALLMSNIILLHRIVAQVIKLVALAGEIQDVFEIVLAHAQQILVSASIKISAIGARWVHQTAALPWCRKRGVQIMQDGWGKIDVGANAFVAPGSFE